MFSGAMPTLFSELFFSSSLLLSSGAVSSRSMSLHYILGEASKISIPAGCRLTYWRIEAAITAEAWLGQLFFSYQPSRLAPGWDLRLGFHSKGGSRRMLLNAISYRQRQPAELIKKMQSGRTSAVSCRWLVYLFLTPRLNVLIARNLFFKHFPFTVLSSINSTSMSLQCRSVLRTF